MNRLTNLQLEFIACIPKSDRSIFERAFSREYGAGRGNAIRAKCLQCSGHNRRTIENCTVETCALHAFRPRFPRRHERQIDADVFDGQCLTVTNPDTGGKE
jgi:hypothetical protein